MENFDPDAAATANSGIFGLPFKEAESKIVLIPVPWEVTVSSGDGTSEGPDLIYECSSQVDLFDVEVGAAWKAGYFLRPPSLEIAELGAKTKKIAKKLLAKNPADPTLIPPEELNVVNSAGERLNVWLEDQVSPLIKAGKIAAVIGGDHSTPYGLLQALGRHYQGDYGILHIDAHADLREGFCDFNWSHASIMWNTIYSDARPSKLVQVGLRDVGESEVRVIKKHPDLIRSYFDMDLKRRQMAGETWLKIAQEIVSHLPKNVYVSFDIDGLDPVLCPGTGTPVPGGLKIEEAFALFRLLAENGKRIVGFDVNEVSPGTLDGTMREWNGNVGARVLYKLCGWAAITNGFAPFDPIVK